MSYHFKISLLKSILRIGGCLNALLFITNVKFSVFVLAVVFILAELLGIAEELQEGRNNDSI